MEDHEAEFSGESREAILSRRSRMLSCWDIECVLADVKRWIRADGGLESLGQGGHEERIANDPLAAICMNPPLFSQLFSRSISREVLIEHFIVGFVLIPPPQSRHIDLSSLRVGSLFENLQTPGMEGHGASIDSRINGFEDGISDVGDLDAVADGIGGG